MSNLSSLKDNRPTLASLAKITKNVMLLLVLSSYISVSATAAQIQI